MLRPICGLIAALVALQNAFGAEPSAERPRGPAAESRIYRDRIQAHWLPGNNQFWYQVQTGSGTHEFVLVDAVQGVRKPAFDHDRLAGALQRAGVKEARAGRLPIENLELLPAEAAVQFRAGGQGWRCDLKDYTLTRDAAAGQGERRSGLPFEGAPRASLRTGEEIFLTFINRTESEVELFWLDAQGQRKSYGRLAAGAEREQHTFAGHVWLAADREGRPLAVFQAEENAGTAEITGRATGPPQRRDGGSKTPPGRTGGASPDSRWQASIRDNNVVVRNTATGQETRLSSDGKPEDAYGGRLYWSPDSTRLVVLQTRKGDDRKVLLIESSPKDQLQPKLHTIDYPKPGDRLPVSKPRLFHVPEGRPIEIRDSLFENPWSIGSVRWAPDSSRFTFLFNQRGHQVLRVVEVDARSGEARPIVDERSDTFICYSSKFFCEHLDDTAELIWMSERDGWNHLYLYDAREGRVKNPITRGPWVVRGVDRVDRARRQVWFRAGGIHPEQSPYQVHYARVDFDGGHLTLLTEGDGTHRIEFSPDRRYYIDVCSRVDLPPIHELRRSEDGRLLCVLERADSSALRATGWRPPERFVAKGRDGVTDIYGIIRWPSRLEQGRKYPVIEAIYAGPQDSFVPQSFSAASPHRAMQERGFVVVQIDGMGTSNRSKQFHDVCWRNLADAGFPDRILWLKAAAAKYPALDLDRVGIFGGSAGGQSALRALIAHGDFYRAAAADCGCHDNRMDKIWWNEQWMGWPVGPHYAEQSNATQAHRLEGHLLLTVGELDRNVDPASTMQVVRALIDADKDFELIVFPGRDHGAGSSPYGARRRLDFFTRHLRPDPGPASSAVRIP